LLRPVKYRTYSTEIPCFKEQPPPASTHIKRNYYTIKDLKKQVFTRKKLKKFSQIFNEILLLFLCKYHKSYIIPHFSCRTGRSFYAFFHFFPFCLLFVHICSVK